MLSFIMTAIIFVSQWFVYKKMGREGWEGIIPVYNSYVMFEVLYGNGWKFLLILIPFYNIYVICKLFIDLAHAFNKSTGFGWGLILVQCVFMPILALSNDIQFGDGSNAVDAKKEIFGNRRMDSAADLLMKYKELLDMGAITQEEYDAKKKEILG